MNGYWERDNSHFPAPMSRYLWELFIPAYDRGSRLGLARYGCAIHRFEFARCNGRLYLGARPVDSPEELEERRKAAKRALTTKLWRQDCTAWSGIKDALRDRLLQLSRQDPLRMHASDLREHVATLKNTFVAGTVQHFFQQPASMFPVGDWVRRTCAWTGSPPSEVVPILRGHCVQTGDYLASIDKVAHELRDSQTAISLLRDQTKAHIDRLTELKGISPALGATLEAYLDEYSDRLVTGFDITDATLRELPQFTVALILSRIDFPDAGLFGVNAAEAEEKLRERLPAQHRANFDESLAEAKVAYGLHDEDVRITYLWPLGLLRRALIVEAKRLVERGALNSIENIFQATPDEVDALIKGSASPSAAELAQRADEWRAWGAEESASTFGEKEPPTPDDVLGVECARVTSAIMFYIGQMEGRGGSDLHRPWSLLVQGLAASPGRYEGFARIIRSPADFGKLGHGDVLVARTTSPAYNVILPTIGAVVTDRGGALCHAAIIAREFGIPAVVGTNDATALIPDGAPVMVDGELGLVAVRS